MPKGLLHCIHPEHRPHTHLQHEGGEADVLRALLELLETLGLSLSPIHHLKLELEFDIILACAHFESIDDEDFEILDDDLIPCVHPAINKCFRRSKGSHQPPRYPSKISKSNFAYAVGFP